MGSADERRDARQLNSSSNGATVSFTNEMKEASGIVESPVELRFAGTHIVTTGEIKADEDRVFHVNSVIGGKLTADFVSLGAFVKTKQTVAMVENLEVMRISANYIHEMHAKDLAITQSQTRLKLALANKNRLERLFNERIAAEKDVLAAQTAWALEEANLRTSIQEKEHQRSEAEALLAAYGVSLREIRDDAPIRFTPIVSPRSGVIVKKNITIGDVVSSSEPLYVVADLSQVWLDITLFDRDVSSVREGAALKFTTDSLPQQVFTGKISYIKPVAQDGRTFVARAVLKNSKFLLKPGMFGHVVLDQPSGNRLPFVPSSAVQSNHDGNVVFVKLSNGLYRSVPVQLGQRTEDGYFVSGVREGQLVVTKGSYYVKEALANHSTEEKP